MDTQQPLTTRGRSIYQLVGPILIEVLRIVITRKVGHQGEVDLWNGWRGTSRLCVIPTIGDTVVGRFFVDEFFTQRADLLLQYLGHSGRHCCPVRIHNPSMHVSYVQIPRALSNCTRTHDIRTHFVPQKSCEVVVIEATPFHIAMKPFVWHCP